MIIRTGLENGNEGKSIAWALDFPGCYAAGRDAGEALMRLPHALAAYADRIQQRAAAPWLELGNFDVQLTEVWDVYTINTRYESASEGYSVNAWFRHDWLPLTHADVEHGLELLRWARFDLLELVSELTPEELNRERPGERWSIGGILRHVANAEWWYLDRLELTEPGRASLPRDPQERLQVTRARFEQALTELVDVELVRGKEGEFWSPRKLLRRALWHEYDHIGHISHLILEN